MSRLVGDPSPQTNPELFSREELVAEVKYLIGLNRRYGSHELRTLAYLKLLREIQRRDDAE